MAVVALAAVGLVGFTAPAYADGGTSANALACQQDGWQSLFRADGSAFTNVGDCVSYGAQGGTLFEASPALQTCASVGGIFGSVDKTGLNPPLSVILWSCNDWHYANVTELDADLVQLLAACNLENLAPASLAPIGLAPIPPGTATLSAVALSGVGEATCGTY